jgi:hypothetical protein
LIDTDANSAAMSLAPSSESSSIVSASSAARSKSATGAKA